LARCDCNGSRCSCVITAGDGITIDGSGDSANPYVIEAARQSIGGQLVVQDTESLDLTLIGEGTDQEPYVLSGVVVPQPIEQITGLIDAGDNIVLSGTGTPDDPYVINATGTGITGLVTAGENITLTGTGTTDDPYVIAASSDIVPSAITGLVTAGTNVTLTGTGTTADPYVIATSTDIVPTAITDLVLPGENVTFTGEGTTDDPYVVSSSVAGLVTAGTNVQVTGAGTGDDPFVVSSEQTLDDLINVTADSAANGDVLRYDTSAGGGTWVSQAPPWMGADYDTRSQYYLMGEVQFDFPSVANGAQVSTELTVPGVDTTQFWIFHVASDRTHLGLHVWADVTSTDTVTVYLSNLTGSGRNTTNGTWRVYGWR
jgi:hypothetical protein